MTLSYTARRELSIRESFEAVTAEHVLQVRLDLSTDPDHPRPYRDLRIGLPNGSSVYSWRIVTVPGELTITGDIADGYTFARLPDMLDFFHPVPEPYRINPDYWAQKLASAQRPGARVFDDEAFVEGVRDHAAQAFTDASDQYGIPEELSGPVLDVVQAQLRRALREEPDRTAQQSSADFLSQYFFTFADLEKVDSVLAARTEAPPEPTTRLVDFQNDPDIHEVMETGMVHSSDLLIAMHAITKGLELYREHLGAPSAPQY